MESNAKLIPFVDTRTTQNDCLLMQDLKTSIHGTLMYEISEKQKSKIKKIPLVISMIDFLLIKKRKSRQQKEDFWSLYK